MHKKIFESFRRFVSEDPASRVGIDIDVYKIGAVLTIANRFDRRKVDILNDVRAIEGITVIKVVDKKTTERHDYSDVTLKIDLTPYGKVPINPILRKIGNEIRNLKGVTSFRFVTKPERVKGVG